MNRSSNVFVDLVVYSFVVAGIFVLTNPQSQGPKFVTAATHGYASIVQAASGQRVTA
jgi:hypothetical protein